MPKFDPFNSSIANAEQQNAFEDKFVDDGKAEEGMSRNMPKNNSQEAPTVITRSSRFSRFSKSSESSTDSPEVIEPKNAIKELPVETQAPVASQKTTLEESSTSRTSRFALRNRKDSTTEEVIASKPQKVEASLEVNENKVLVEENKPVVLKDVKPVEVSNEAKPTGRARFMLNRAKPTEENNTQIVASENDETVSKSLNVLDEVKPTISLDNPSTSDTTTSAKTNVATSEENTKSTRFSFKNRTKEVSPVETKKEATTIEVINPISEKPALATVEKAPWEDDEQESNELENIATEKLLPLEEVNEKTTQLDEPKKKFSLKKKSDVKAVESKNLSESLDQATQSSDSIDLNNQSVEKNSHDQLNAIEKRVKIEKEVENATHDNSTPPSNEEDVFRLDFDSAVVEANKNNKKGAKMSLEKEEPKQNSKKQYTPEEQEEFQRKKAAFKALAEKVDTIKLKEVFEMVGAHNNEDKIRSKWKMPWGDNVSLKGQQWYNHNGSNGGWGAVSFAKYAYASENHLDLKAEENQIPLYRAAVNMLADYFGEQVDNDEIMAKVEDLKKEEKQGYLPPAKLSDDYLNKVIDYLHQERNLPLWLINKQIEAGKLYAGVPDWVANKLRRANTSVENAPDSATYCIFATKYTAECRCISDETFENAVSPKGFASGSEKKLYGFTVVPDRKSDTPIVAVTEASIDAMSYHSLYPDRFVISTGGADNFTLLSKLALETIENNWAFHCAYDNDHAGDNDYQNLIKFLTEELGEEKVKELIETNMFVRDIPPQEKDWNKYIQDHVQVEELDNIYTNYVDEGKKTKKAKKATTPAT